MTVPRDLLDALEKGVMTEDQLRRLIEIEAKELGMTLDEALRRAEEGSLPTGPIGIDIEYLAGLIAA